MAYNYDLIVVGGGAAGMFSAGTAAYDVLRSVVVLLLLALFSTPYPRKALDSFRARRGRPAEIAVTVLVFLLFFLSVAALVASDYSPFLYTRF